MPLGQGIAELLGAIPARIEVSGHDPTWRVTGATFDDALDYVRERFGDAAVVEREDRSRWWPRVTLVVTTDPARAASAPPLSELRDAVPDPEPEPAAPAPAAAPDAAWEPGTPEEEPEPGSISALEEIFAHQESLHAQEVRVPRQRGRRGAHRNEA
jgi:hypothetical protein